LVRPSNTQALLVLRFEGETEADLEAIQKEVRGVLAEVISRLNGQ
jgi:phosphomannomutase